MNRMVLIVAGLLLINTAWAEHLDLDQLLRDVKKSQGIEGRINRQREARFLAEKNRQQQLLAEAKAALARAEARSSTLKSQLDANEQELTILETKLNERSGILGELLGVAKQAAGDLSVELHQSLVSAQFPGRGVALEKIADSKALPTIEQLETLWFNLLQEMTESGKVVRFDTEILAATGEPQSAEVVRIGAFNALSGGKYLRYLPETGKLVELARQPEGRYLDLAEDFIAAKQGQRVDIGIDPTRGVLLSLLIQKPDLLERIQQGGIIGYIILLLGAVGFVVAIIRLLQLYSTGRKMDQQLHDLQSANTDNPLGRVILASEQSLAGNLENLELMLDEAITQEVPKLEKGLPMIKLLAGVAPLLGLLGTVTGMIATFQAISLFGTGDPKLMASGISQALVTTMLGLMVAIPLLFLHSLLASRSRALVQILDEQSAGLISRIAGK